MPKKDEKMYFVLCFVYCCVVVLCLVVLCVMYCAQRNAYNRRKFYDVFCVVVFCVMFCVLCVVHKVMPLND